MVLVMMGKVSGGGSTGSRWEELVGVLVGVFLVVTVTVACDCCL